MDSRIRNLGKLAIKVTISTVALMFVFRSIDTVQLLHIMSSANPWWLILAWVAYNISKILSALRLAFYFDANNIYLSTRENVVLYYIGMFYNLFLPGGIGGDAYKIWLLHRDASARSVAAVQAVIYDRLSGMAMLTVLGFAFAWWAFPEIPFRPMLVVAGVMTVPAFYFLNRILSKQFLPGFLKTSMLSLGVQGLQVICAYAILVSLGINNFIGAYLAVFLLSSIVSVIPISIGGIGIRELVFVTAAGYSAISKDASVAFSLLFFLTTAVSSIPGGFLSNPIAREPET